MSLQDFSLSLKMTKNSVMTQPQWCQKHGSLLALMGLFTDIGGNLSHIKDHRHKSKSTRKIFLGGAHEDTP